MKWHFSLPCVKLFSNLLIASLLSWSSVACKVEWVNRHVCCYSGLCTSDLVDKKVETWHWSTHKLVTISFNNVSKQLTVKVRTLRVHNRPRFQQVVSISMSLTVSPESKAENWYMIFYVYCDPLTAPCLRLSVIVWCFLFSFALELLFCVNKVWPC